MPAQDERRLLRKWLVFVSRFTVMFFLTGSVKTGGILFNTVVSEGMSGAMTGFILILPYAVGRLSGPIVSVLLNFFSYRLLGTVGGVLVGGGYVLTGLFASSSVHHIIFSIISGFGFGCLLLPVSLCLKDHFQQEFPSIMPLSMAGSYAGITVMPPLMELCRQAYGNEGTYILFGALSWNLIPCGLLLQKPSFCGTEDDFTTDEKEEEREDELVSDQSSLDKNKMPQRRNTVVTEDDNVVTCCGKIWSDVKENSFLFANIIFSIFFFVANARKLPADGWTLFLIPHTIERGFPPIQAAQVASVGGVTGIVGRFIASVSFKFNLSPLLIYAFYFYLNGAIFILLEWARWLSESLIAQYAGSALNGCLLSAQSGMTPGVLVYILDASSFRTAYGLLDLGNGVLSLVAGLVPGLLFDGSGNFEFAFFLFGFISIFNGILVCVLWAVVHFRRKKPPS